MARFEIPLTQAGLYGGHNLHGISPGYLLKAENVAFDDGCLRKEGGASRYNSPIPYSWTERANPKNFALNDVVWTGEKFIAVGAADGTDAYIITSTDSGVTWAESANPLNFALNSVTFNLNIVGDFFIAVGAADGVDAYIVSSADGSTWNERANPKNITLQSVATNSDGTVIVAVGNADGTDAYIITSADSSTWTEQAPTVAKNIALNHVVWAPWLSLFVAVGAADGTDAYILTSPDGVTWTERAAAVSKNITLNSIAMSGSLLVAVGNADGADAYILTSDNGTTWTERSNPRNINLLTAFFSGEAFYAAGATDGTDSYMVMSDDGVTWVEVANPKAFSLFGAAFSGNKFVMVGAADGTDAYIITATFADAATERTNPKDFQLQSVVWTGSLFVAVGFADGTDAYIVTSPDGTTWTERANAQNLRLNKVIYTGDRLVAVGNSSYIITSDDGGTTWTQRSAGLAASSTLNSIAWSGDTFVVVGNATGTDAAITISNDAVNWTEQPNPKNTHLNDVAWNGELFVAVGDFDVVGGDVYILTSPDGETWTERANALGSTSLVRIAWTGTEFITHDGTTSDFLVINANLIFAGRVRPSLKVSSDGITWSTRANILYSNGAINSTGVPEPNDLVVSFDAVTWFGIRTPGFSDLNTIQAIAFNGASIVGVGDGTTDAYIVTMALSSTALAGATYFLGASYWNYDGATPKIVALDTVGRLLMDNYDGIFDDVLDTALTVTADTYPVFVEGGKEVAANNKKLFIFTGANIVQVLSGAATSTANITTPPADWTAATQPTGGLIHDSRLWGYGNSNDPHRLYYTGTTDHEDFSLGGSIPVYPGQGEKIVNAISYKGYIIVFKYPKGIYIVDTTSVLVAGWRVNKLNENLGGAGQGSAAVVEEDLIFIDHTGEIRTLAGITEYGDIGSRSLSDVHDISVFIRDNYQLSDNTKWRMIYYSKKRELHIGASSNEISVNNNRMVIDFNRELPRFRNSTRDNCLYLFTREVDGVPEMLHCDNLGNIWQMDQPDKNKGGLGYTCLFQTTHSDLGDPTTVKNGEFLEIAFEPTGDVDISFDIIWDGVYQETTTINLDASDVVTGRMIINKAVPLVGDGIRLSLIGRNNNADQDFALQGLWVHYSPAGSSPQNLNE